MRSLQRLADPSPEARRRLILVSYIGGGVPFLAVLLVIGGAASEPVAFAIAVAAILGAIAMLLVPRVGDELLNVVTCGIVPAVACCAAGLAAGDAGPVYAVAMIAVSIGCASVNSARVTVVSVLGGSVTAAILLGRALSPAAAIALTLLYVVIDVVICGAASISRRRYRQIAGALERVAVENGAHVYSGELLADGRYVELFAGPGGRRFIGGPFDGPLDEVWRSRIHPDDRGAHVAAVASTELRGGRPVSVEYRMVGLDGVERWVWERLSPRRERDRLYLDGIALEITERKLVELALVEQRRLLDAIVASSGADVFAGEFREDGTFVDLFDGRGAERLLGRAPEAALETVFPLWLRSIHPEDRALVDASLAAQRRGENTEIEYRVIDAHGDVRRVLGRVSAERGANGRMQVLGVIVDITESRRVQTELDRTRELLDAVLEQQHVYVHVGRFSDGLYVAEYGPGAPMILGGEPSHGSALSSWRSRVHPDELDQWEAADAAARAGEAYECQYRLVGYDGVVRWVWDRGAGERLDNGDVRVHGIAADVTSRVLAEDELRLAHERLAAVLEESRAHVFEAEVLADGAGYGSVYLGPGAEHLLGAAAPVAAAGAGEATFWRGLVHDDDLAGYDAGVASQLRGEPCDMEYRLRGLDGIERNVWERTTTRAAAGGRRIITGFVADVSERRRAAEELRAAHEHLSRIVDRVGQVVYTVDVEARRAIYSAGRWEAFIGVDPGPVEDLVETIAQYVHADDRPVYGAGWDHLLAAGASWSERYRYVRADGSVAWVSERASTRLAADGRLLADGVIIDVTAEHEAERQLAAVRDRLARVAEAVDEVLFTVTVEPGAGLDDERFYVGPGIEGILGGEPPAGVSLLRGWRDRLHPDDGPVVDAYLAVVGRGDAEIEVRVVGDDGLVRWAWVRSRVRAEAGRVVIDGIVSDVTERRRAAAELERASRIDPLTGAFNRRHFVEAAARAAGAGATGLVLVDVDHFKRVNDVYGHVAGDAVLVEAVQRMEAVAGVGATLCRWGGEEFALLVVAADESELQRQANALCRAVGQTPFALAGSSLRITVSCGAAHAGTGRAIDEMVAAADHALYAAKRRGRDRVCLETELVEADRIAEAPESVRIAEAMARATAVREGVPERHCHKVAELAAATAERLGLAPELVLRTRMGGFLHDVGKIAIPDRILTKPGPLDAEEWATMQTHTTIGRDLVLSTPGLAEAAAVVAHHHERWDGSGYPAGLVGEEIPLDARIVAAVDAWCAMTEDRVYRAGLPREEALAELRRSAGSHLDATVVAVLTALILDGYDDLGAAA
jgi:diguanylate cyclase (GGDEF)-like protein/PAS domain S-box-containing protein